MLTQIKTMMEGIKKNDTAQLELLIKPDLLHLNVTPIL
jgi:hypothetical protein